VPVVGVEGEEIVLVVRVESEDDVADDEDEKEAVDDVTELDNDKENVDEAEIEMGVIGMVTDVVGVAEDMVDTEVGVGKLEGVAVVVNCVVDGGVAVVVIGGVVGDVVCGADGRITVGGNEDPP
jgi:hypothetical protein